LLNSAAASFPGEARMKNVRLLKALRDRSHAVVPPVSRRRFLQTSAGALAAGVTLGRQLLNPSVANAAAGADPIPVPGSPFLAPFHIWAPIFVDSIDAEPSSITNFNGVVGMTYASGMVRRTNLLTHEVRDLPFLGTDMRFMQGVYRGVDGKPRQGTFGFV
jgi:hypothetical protein